MSSVFACAQRARVWWVMALLLFVTASAASAETLLMPPRDFLAGASEVVWGISTQPNATACSLEFGDGAVQDCTGADRSYIAFNHTYPLAGTYTVTLTKGAEVATTEVRVYNAGALSAENLRNLNINRAIQNGLRYLWFSQSNRTTFDTNNETAWGNFPLPFTALVVLAFENHGYTLPNSNAAPTGIFPKYAVRRGFNYILARLTSLTIGLTPQGDNPCVAVPAPTCLALSAQTTGAPGYENAIAILPFAASNALGRTVTEVAAANVNGRTFGEVLQRMLNATMWGQNDNVVAVGRGGWVYTFNSTSSDNSTNGWDMLALLDGAAAGATVPVWVRNEWSNFALPNGLNNDGSFDYRADGNRALNGSVNVAKTGVALQGMFYAGRPVGNGDVQNAIDWISDRWYSTTASSMGQSFVCGNGTYNIHPTQGACAYGMYNVFKGLRLYGVQTLPGVTRGAGPGAIPAGDWYADYVDWLVANQTSPTSTSGGHWASLYFSSQTSNEPAEAALAELILADVALIAPDPDRFSTVGLQHGNPLTTDPQSNPVNTSHTVTALVESTSGSPIAGATVSFQVSGRNSGTGSGTSDANGRVTFTYSDTGAAGAGGQDSIQAFIGQVGSNLASNVLTKNWVLQVNRCDADADGDVDGADLLIIRNANGQLASSSTDPRDGNGDGRINVADVRYCQLRQTSAVQ